MTSSGRNWKIASTFLELLAASPRVPCAEDSNKFYADSQDEEEPYDDEHMEEAVAVCGTCPIQRECLLQALTNKEQFGVWGGFTPAQREQMRWSN